MKKFLKGFVYAFRGLRIMTHERNMRFHLVVGWIVILASIYFRITRTEWMTILLCIAAVLSAETFNTAIEAVCNVARDHCGAKYEHTGAARDMSAGAVLIIAIIAGIIGMIIFTPYLISLFW
ncbi:MAG: diacylglycerol kinase family protein [Candidatus Woesebacteria bacterium]